MEVDMGILKTLNKTLKSIQRVAEVGEIKATELKDEVAIDSARNIRKKILKLINKFGVDEARSIVKTAYDYSANKKVIQNIFEEIASQQSSK
jgi:hypothetical protein